jgi:bifunctional UDP-N-acetylglucosamine pyrophosphorylase/glucosamine-1-phosphate N-acetyltransferase
VGERCVVEQTVGVECTIGDDAHVGPFAHLPAGSSVVSGAVTGAFYTAPVE